MLPLVRYLTVQGPGVDGLLLLGVSNLCGILLKEKRKPDKTVGQCFVLRKAFIIVPFGVTSLWY